MTRTSFTVSLIKILELLGDGTPACVSDIARKVGVNWKTARKALDLLMDIDNILDGRIVRKQVIGSNKVHTIVDKPTIQHGNEVDIVLFFEMRNSLEGVLEMISKSTYMEILDDAGYTYETEYRSKMITNLRKTINSINTIIEPTGLIEEDVLELHRVRSMITEAIDSYDENQCDTLLSGLISLFTCEWMIKSKVGKQVSSEIMTYIGQIRHNLRSRTVLKSIRRIITRTIGKTCGVDKQ